ncbi:hypothetical protein QUF74_12795 [Candidatus Halobeggiatoa sp. HSG11]|nr:hypothetical protein [Candidatus Halobeggiatoa sp. HSG11]
MEKLKESLSSYWLTIQNNLFPWLAEEIGDLTKKQMSLITVLEIMRIERHIPNYHGLSGRPQSDRIAIAFIAKAIYDMSTTRILLDRLECDIALRRICGWEKNQIFQVNQLFQELSQNLSKIIRWNKYKNL